LGIETATFAGKARPLVLDVGNWSTVAKDPWAGESVVVAGALQLPLFSSAFRLVGRCAGRLGVVVVGALQLLLFSSAFRLVGRCACLLAFVFIQTSAI